MAQEDVILLKINTEPAEEDIFGLWFMTHSGWNNGLCSTEVPLGSQ